MLASKPIWVVETRDCGKWLYFDKEYSRKLAYMLAAFPRAGGYKARVRKIVAELNIAHRPDGVHVWMSAE